MSETAKNLRTVSVSAQIQTQNYPRKNLQRSRYTMQPGSITLTTIVAAICSFYS
jgi:hypothetical protein